MGWAANQPPDPPPGMAWESQETGRPLRSRSPSEPGWSFPWWPPEGGFLTRVHSLPHRGDHLPNPPSEAPGLLSSLVLATQHWGPRDVFPKARWPEWAGLGRPWAGRGLEQMASLCSSPAGDQAERST